MYAGDEFYGDEVTSGPIQDEDEQWDRPMCECEQDWNCGLHSGNGRLTWIETRYANDIDPDDPHYY
jgi:hypothetical protein